MWMNNGFNLKRFKYKFNSLLLTQFCLTLHTTESIYHRLRFDFEIILKLTNIQGWNISIGQLYVTFTLCDVSTLQLRKPWLVSQGLYFLCKLDPVRTQSSEGHYQPDWIAVEEPLHSGHVPRSIGPDVLSDAACTDAVSTAQCWWRAVCSLALTERRAPAPPGGIHYNGRAVWRKRVGGLAVHGIRLQLRVPCTPYLSEAADQQLRCFHACPGWWILAFAKLCWGCSSSMFCSSLKEASPPPHARTAQLWCSEEMLLAVFPHLLRCWSFTCSKPWRHGWDMRKYKR